MIQMTVSQQDMGQGQPAFGDGGQQLVCFAARIDEGGLMGLVTPDEEQFWANWVTGITSNFNIWGPLDGPLIQACCSAKKSRQACLSPWKMMRSRLLPSW